MITWITNKSHLNTLDGNQELADSFYNLCMALSSEPPRDCKNDASSICDLRTYRLIGNERRWIKDEGVRNALEEFKDKLLVAIKETEQRGIDKGKNLLRQLNTGDLTLKDFEKIN